MLVRRPPPAKSGIVPSLLAGWLLVLSAGLAQAQADNQPHGLTATVSGRRVTLSWLAPIRVTQPLTGYLIEAGANPGATAVSLPVAAVPTYSVIAPNGRYYVRVRGLLGGSPGPASNEVLVVVPALPAAPANFTASVARFTVSLTWTSGAGGGFATGWQVHAGSGPGLSDLAIVPMPLSARLLTAAVAAGTYYVRVVAVNASGAGPPSQELVVTTGPNICDVPLMPTGLTATAGQGGVLLQWDEWSGPLPTGYLLSAGRSPGASDVGTFPLARRTGLATFAPAGTYYARLAAVNACGQSPVTPDIAFTVAPPGGASLIGTWVGTVSDYSQPFPWTPITSFQLTLNANPSGPGGPLPGLWTDNKGCRSTLIAGGITVLPYISIESLACNDGDFVLTITSSTSSVVEGRCNAGPNCRFRMTRR
jgi:hypothetical protein